MLFLFCFPFVFFVDVPRFWSHPLRDARTISKQVQLYIFFILTIFSPTGERCMSNRTEHSEFCETLYFQCCDRNTNSPCSVLYISFHVSYKNMVIDQDMQLTILCSRTHLLIDIDIVKRNRMLVILVSNDQLFESLLISSLCRFCWVSFLESHLKVINSAIVSTRS